MKKHLNLAVVLVALLGAANPARAGILLGLAPFTVGGSDDDQIVTAIVTWPLGLASTVTGLVLLATGHSVAGAVLVGLDEGQRPNRARIYSTLTDLYPQIQDPEVYEMLVTEIEKRSTTSETVRDQGTGNLYHYVTIPKDRLEVILSPSGILESGKADPIIRTMSE